MTGKKLKHLIKLNKCKQIDLAKYLNISPSRLSNYISDKREPSIELLTEMATYLGVDLNYFADVDFSKQNKKTYSTSEKSSTYGSKVREDIINVPFTSLNAKKRGINSITIPFSKLFLSEVKKPESNAFIFELNTDLPSDQAKEGDYIVCSKCNDVELNDGDFIFENGRDSKFFSYYNHEGKVILISESNKKEHITINNKSELDNYFKILWVISKYR